MYVLYLDLLYLIPNKVEAKLVQQRSTYRVLVRAPAFQSKGPRYEDQSSQWFLIENTINKIK